jgi:hypothetical protein
MPRSNHRNYTGERLEPHELICEKGEEWRYLPTETEYKNMYAVSSHGRVANLEGNQQNPPGFIRKIVTILKKGEKKTHNQVLIGTRSDRIVGVAIPHMVASVFIPCDFIDAKVIHIDGDNLNDHVSNLKWCNMSDVYNIHSPHIYKQRINQVPEIRIKYASGTRTMRSLAKEYNTGYSTIHRIIHKLTHKRI